MDSVDRRIGDWALAEWHIIQPVRLGFFTAKTQSTQRLLLFFVFR